LGSQRSITSFGRAASPLVTRRFDKPAFENEELVVVASPLFPHRITKGYDDPNRSVLSEVNGIKIRNLRHLVELLRDNHDEQLSFKFASGGVLTHETMVFNRADLMEATGKILEENGIRYSTSPDLRAVWEGGPTEMNRRRAAQTTCCPPPITTH
jgi:hypothetical protein